jgi:hypothetical protein
MHVGGGSDHVHSMLPAFLRVAGGNMVVTAHVVPNSALKVADIPDGASTFNTVAGTPIKIEKRWEAWSCACSSCSSALHTRVMMSQLSSAIIKCLYVGVAR